MTDRESNPLAGSPKDIAAWVKEALEEWFETRNSLAFYPYKSEFRLSFEPHQVLLSIYRGLSRKGGSLGLRSSPAAKFRLAIARLLSEPEVYRRDYRVYFELLRLGSEIGSSEVLASLRTMLRQHALPTTLVVDEAGHSKKINILAETVDAVLRSGFVGGEVVRFLKSAIGYVKNHELSADTILLALARLDQTNWALHAAEFADSLTMHFELNAHPDVQRNAKASFRQRLEDLVGVANYRSGIEELREAGMLDELKWLISQEIAGTWNPDNIRSNILVDHTAAQDIKAVSSKDWNIPFGDILPEHNFGRTRFAN